MGRMVGVPTPPGWRRLLTYGIVLAGLAVWALPVTGLLRGGSQQFQAADSRYERANRLFERATGQRAYDGLQVLLRSHNGVSAADAAREVGMLLAREQGFERVRDSWLGGHRVLLAAAFAGADESVAAARRLREWRASRMGRAVAAGRWMLVGGPDVAFGALESRTRAAVEQVELLASPLLLLMCLLIFGMACLLPMLVGLVTVVVVFAVLRLLDVVLGLGISIYALPAVTGLALGLSVDYSLLLVSRYREEAGKGDGRLMAAARRTVILSCLTIAAAMLCLLVIPLKFLSSVGIAGALTAVTAGLTARLLIPAALRLFGGHLVLAPTIGRGSGWGWQRLAGWVTARPLPIAGITIVLLLAAGTPLLGLRWQPPSAQLLPASAESRRLEDALSHGQGPDPAAAIYTIDKPGRHGISVAALAAAQTRIAAGHAQITGPLRLGRGTWQITILPHGLPNSPANQRLLAKIQALDARAGAVAGGITAFAADQQQTIAGGLPLALAILALVIAASLWLATGSVVIAVKGVLMAALSATAGIGLLIAVVGRIEEADLIFMAAVALALSADYELFLISRIAEARRDGLSNTQAITAGLHRTGPLISSAALLFITAVAPLAASSLSFARQFGIGAALTVAIDATLVRALLVPALMVLLADRNWWSPAILARLHTRIQAPLRSPNSDDLRPAAGRDIPRRAQCRCAATQTGGA
jgi:uncharacterized membrane protein YdfJ with MMPL/SSD domain